jgi:C-terminal processing protease CtpA/Prc
MRALCVPLVLTLCLVSCASLSAQVDLNFERGRTKDILKVVSDHIENEYYDPALKGLNWKDLVDQTKARIDRAKSVGEMQTAIFALVDKLHDSHTKFLPPGHVTRMDFGFKAKPFGEDILVYEVDKDGSARAAGLELGDRIVSVNGFGAVRGDYDQMMLFFRALRPQPSLNIEFVRGNNPPKNLKIDAKVKQGMNVQDLTHGGIYDLIRESESESAKAPEVMWANYDDGIEYLRLRSFESAPEWMHDLLGKFTGSKGMIVDLRGNHGGRVDTMKFVASCFADKPDTVANLAFRKKTEPLKIEPKSPHLPNKLVILIDSESFSAAEAFSRYMQLAQHTPIVGDHSQGRLTVARFYPEASGMETKVFYGAEVSVARFVLSNGEELEGKGITPDKLCNPTPADLHDGRDPCLDEAISMLRRSLNLADSPAEKREKEGKINQ